VVVGDCRRDVGAGEDSLAQMKALARAVVTPPVSAMIGVSGLSWLATSAGVDPPTSRGGLLGVIGALPGGVGPSVMIESVYRRTPAKLTRFLTAAFAGKMVFFGVYVTIMLRGVSLPPVPFVAGFTAYFITLHLIEALSLRRLFAS